MLQYTSCQGTRDFAEINRYYWTWTLNVEFLFFKFCLLLLQIHLQAVWNAGITCFILKLIPLSTISTNASSVTPCYYVWSPSSTDRRATNCPHIKVSTRSSSTVSRGLLPVGRCCALNAKWLSAPLHLILFVSQCSQQMSLVHLDSSIPGIIFY